MMVGGSKTHALIASQLMRALWARIDVKKWVVLGSDLAVDVGPDSLRYPDAIVDSIGGQRALVATGPVLIAEVLSPSSATLDLGDKAAEYLRLPTLAAYLVLSQDGVKVWVYLKGSNQLPGPQVISGAGAAISIAALRIDLPLAEIYAGVEFKNSP
jgi:Uma2 family endonuclease